MQENQYSRALLLLCVTASFLPSYAFGMLDSDDWSLEAVPLHLEAKEREVLSSFLNTKNKNSHNSSQLKTTEATTTILTNGNVIDRPEKKMKKSKAFFLEKRENENSPKTIKFDLKKNPDSIKEIPRSRNLLIALCPYSVGPDVDPDTKYTTLVDGHKKARDLFFAKCNAYKEAKKYYARATKEAQNNPNDSHFIKILSETQEAFEKIQIWFLLKFSPLDKIIQLNKNKYEVGTTINKNGMELPIFKYTFDPEEFEKETNNIREIVNKPREVFAYKPKENTLSILSIEKKPERVPGCYIEPHEIQEEFNKIKKLISSFTREQEILSDVRDIYAAFVADVTGLGFWKFGNWCWHWTTLLAETEAEIKKCIHKKYPSAPYELNLTHPVFAEEGKLYVYNKDKDLYLKIKNKEEMQILSQSRTCTSGLKGDVYKMVLYALTDKIPYLLPEYRRRVFNFASLCGYLPDNIRTRETLRAIGTEKEILDILQGKLKWSERPQLSKLIAEERLKDTEVEALERNYRDFPKFLDLENYHEGVVNDENETLSFYLYPSKEKHHKKMPLNLAVSYIPEPDDKPYATSFPAYATAYPHRRKLSTLLNEFVRNRELIREGQKQKDPNYEYEIELLGGYMEICEQSKSFLLNHLRSISPLISDAGFKVPGSWSAYQAETHRKKVFLKELNLFSSNLNDDSFFYQHDGDEAIYSPYEEKEWQKLRLLSRDPTEDSLESIQKGELGLYCVSGKMWYYLYLKVYNKAAIQLVSSDDPAVLGCPSQAYERLLEAMRVPKEEADHTAIKILHSDKRALFKYASSIGYTEPSYLLDTFERIVLAKNKLVGSKIPTFSKNLKELYVGNNFLSSTKIISNLKNLEIFDAQDNLINSLEGLPTCLSLRHLHLEGNQLRAAEEISQLGNLTYLNLASNHFTATDFLNTPVLKNLTYLNMSRNKITNLESVGYLTNLTELNISYNNVQTITSLSKLLSLRTITANNNHLTGCMTTYFPEKDGSLHLSELESLDISYNIGASFSQTDELLTKENFKELAPNMRYLHLKIRNKAVVYEWDEKKKKKGL